jgi:WW domain-containing oxidoreductase
MSEWESPFGAKSTADEVLAGLDLRGKIALVTGANVGLGYETARALASRRAQVILACRSREKSEDAARRIRHRHPDADLEIGELDLGSLQSVRRFVDELEAPEIHMLICNAGVYGGGYHETAEGFERTVGVCHIGHFLLVHLLLDRLERAGGARVVMVSSESHRQPRTLDFDQLPLSRERYSDLKAYGQAKLCNLLFVNELQRRYEDTGLNAYGLHPGNLVPTAIGRHSLLARTVIQLVRPFTKSLSQGAATIVLCAAHPEVEGLGGRYFADCQLRRPSREAERPEVAARLWELSEEWTGLAAG